MCKTVWNIQYEYNHENPDIEHFLPELISWPICYVLCRTHKLDGPVVECAVYCFSGVSNYLLQIWEQLQHEYLCYESHLFHLTFTTCAEAVPDRKWLRLLCQTLTKFKSVANVVNLFLTKLSIACPVVDVHVVSWAVVECHQHLLVKPIHSLHLHINANIMSVIWNIYIYACTFINQHDQQISKFSQNHAATASLAV